MSETADALSAYNRFYTRQIACWTAKLCQFYLEPEARGLGVGRRMLEACTSFAMVCETPVHNYGQDLVG